MVKSPDVMSFQAVNKTHTHTHINFTWSPVNLSRTQSHILVASGSDPVLSNKKQLALVNTAQQKIYSARRPQTSLDQVKP